MKHHEAANLFPMMAKEQLGDLASDIKENGLLAPIEVYKGKIIDGRNRWLACELADIEPDIVDVEPDDPIAYVLSANLHRRHLSESQRAMVGARLKERYSQEAKDRRKRKPKDSVVVNLPQQNGKARDAAGKAVNVSGSSVDHASRVVANGSAALVQAVDSGEVAVSTAAKLSTLPKAEQIKAARAACGKNPTAHVARSCGENEWYTPVEFLESARAVHGVIANLESTGCVLTSADTSGVISSMRCNDDDAAPMTIRAARYQARQVATDWGILPMATERP